MELISDNYIVGRGRREWCGGGYLVFFLKLKRKIRFGLNVRVKVKFCVIFY